METLVLVSRGAATPVCGNGWHRGATESLKLLNDTLAREGALVCLGAPLVDRDIWALRKQNPQLVAGGDLCSQDCQVAYDNDPTHAHVGPSSIDIPVRISLNPRRPGWVIFESLVGIALPSYVGGAILRRSQDSRRGGTLGHLHDPIIEWPSAASYALIPSVLLRRGGFHGQIRVEAPAAEFELRSLGRWLRLQLVLFRWNSATEHFSSRVSESLLDEANAARFPGLVDVVLPRLTSGTHHMVHFSNVPSSHAIRNHVHSDLPLAVTGAKVALAFAPRVPRGCQGRLQIGEATQSLCLPRNMCGLLCASFDDPEAPNWTTRDPGAGKAAWIHPGSSNYPASEESSARDCWGGLSSGKVLLLQTSDSALHPYCGQFQA